MIISSMKLPEVSGANLARQRMRFPADFAGDSNLVFVAFQQWQQTQVDSWIPLAQSLFAEFAGFEFYEFPTIRRLNFLARTFINEGMRAGIGDDDTRARTITLYLDKEPLKRSLQIDSEDDIWIFLFDRQGRAMWRARGAYTPEKGSALRHVVAATLTPPGGSLVDGVTGPLPDSL